MENTLHLPLIARPSLSRTGPIAYALPMSEPDDSQLMVAYGRGDVQAFETLYVKYKDGLYRYLLRMSRDPAMAEDLSQEVWAKLIHTRSRYRPDARFSTFLYRVAHNAFIDSTRRNRHQIHQTTFDVECHGDPAASPDETIDRQRLKQDFLNALTALPQEQRDAYLLHEEAGLTVASIAEVTGVTRETAKSRIRYAVTKLKRVIANPALVTGDQSND